MKNGRLKTYYTIVQSDWSFNMILENIIEKKIILHKTLQIAKHHFRLDECDNRYRIAEVQLYISEEDE